MLPTFLSRDGIIDLRGSFLAAPQNQPNLQGPIGRKNDVRRHFC